MYAQIAALRDLLKGWINNHFEQIIIGILFWFIGILIIKFLVIIRLAWPKKIKLIVDRVLHDSLTAGLVALLFLTFYNFLVNFSKKEILDFSYRVKGDTKWVEAKRPIYFIVQNELLTIQPNGQNRQLVFEAADEIRSYHFSPDDRFILLATATSLYLLDKKEVKSHIVDSINLTTSNKTAGITGVIDGVRWSPDSRKFCYHISKWGNFSSQENWVIFDVPTGQRHPVKNPALKMASLIWDETGENLYYLWFEALDTSRRGNPYEVKVYQVPLSTLMPGLILKFPYSERMIPRDNLDLRGIHFFDPDDYLSFGRELLNREFLMSSQGGRVGIDEYDNLYYIHSRWWKRRLYQIPRVPVKGDIDRYQFRGGELAIRHLRWLPGGRYLIMDHHYFGVLIMEPATGKVGILTSERNGTFGWHDRPVAKPARPR